MSYGMYWTAKPALFLWYTLILATCHGSEKTDDDEFFTTKISKVSETAVLPSNEFGDALSKISSQTAFGQTLRPLNSSLSVLSRFRTHGKLYLKPYPYLVVRNALDPALYAELEAAFLTDAEIFELSGAKQELQNHRLDIWAKTALEHAKVPDLWKDFVAYHISRDFYDEVHELFAREIQKTHPQKRGYKTGMRFRDEATSDVLLDCQIAINTPVKERSSVRGPHIDGADEIYAGLFYLRNANDTRSTGGDFQVCECRNPPCVIMPKRFRAQYGTGDTHFRPSEVRVLNKAYYKANTFVMFINSKDAIHAVTPRSVTPFSRRLVNIIAVSKGGGKLVPTLQRNMRRRSSSTSASGDDGAALAVDEGSNAAQVKALGGDKHRARRRSSAMSRRPTPLETEVALMDE